MAHSHAHSHGEGEGTYFLDQLFTILACGAIGLVAVLMYENGMLTRILVDMFYIPVLVAGIALLALAAIRAVAVWQLAGARRADADMSDGHDEGHSHAHSHSHGHDHAHAHGEECEHDDRHGRAHSHAHDHGEGDDHGHDHGWAPWRYMVLAVPVFLFFLGLPREMDLRDLKKYGQDTGGRGSSPTRDALSMLVGSPAQTRILRKPDPKVLELKFKELSEAAAFPGRHEKYEGDIARLRGMYMPLKSDREFTLLRVDRTCCFADQIMLEMRIEAPEAIQGVEPAQWVWIEGLISFQKNEKGRWIPVITMRSMADLNPTAEPTNDANKP